MIVGFTFILESKTTVGNVIQVLQPFKERNGHTTGINVQIGNNQNFAIDQNAIGGRCSWTVGSFSNNLRYKTNFDFMRYKKKTFVHQTLA